MSGFFREGITKNVVPLILCFSIVTCCMYVYSREYLWLFMLITAAIQISAFSFYTYIAKKSMLMRFISILGSFISIIVMVMIALKTGNNKSSIDYFIWFLSPQALVEFSWPYIAATFIIINFFIASTVYYFSAVRYRISMTFMITLIPFAVYRKEGEEVPVIFALILLVMYMALMIHCRQINTKPRQKFISDSGYVKSMVLFLSFTSLLAIAIPRPDIKINNSWVDSVFESEKLTEYMLNRLGIVSETASSSDIYKGSSNIKLYEFKIEEAPVNLKSQTFSEYNFEENLWKTIPEELQGYELKNSIAENLNPEMFYSAVAEAAALDDDFSGKYALENIVVKDEMRYTRNISLIFSRVPAKYYYTPVLSYDVTSASGSKVFRSPQGMLFSGDSSVQNYTVKYYSDAFIYNTNMRKIVNELNSENFPGFLKDINKVFEENNITEYKDVLDSYEDDYLQAMEYLQKNETELPDSLHRLSEEIVRKRKSDFEKAVAIQDYFKLNDYVYDLGYKKPDDYNMEFFLTEGKRGICSDYATAMVLLARSAGIPARYAEGINLHDPDENGIVTVTDSDLHAFPELYISGFGWMSFEPTQISSSSTKASFDIRMSVVVSVAAVLIILFIILYDVFIRTKISEKIFFLKLRKATPEKSVELIFIRIRELLELDKSKTSAETGEYIREVYGLDSDRVVEIFDSIIYGGESAGENIKRDALEFYTKLAEIKKEEKKTIRKMKK